MKLICRQFVADSVKQVAERPGIGVGPLDQFQHDVAAADQRCLGNQRIEGTALELLCQIQKRLGHLEEHLDVPAETVELDDLLGGQGRVGGKKRQPLL